MMSDDDEHTHATGSGAAGGGGGGAGSALESYYAMASTTAEDAEASEGDRDTESSSSSSRPTTLRFAERTRTSSTSSSSSSSSSRGRHRSQYSNSSTKLPGGDDDDDDGDNRDITFDNDDDEDEEALRTKGELFGPRKTKQTTGSTNDDDNNTADDDSFSAESFDDESWMKFDLGDLDITTVELDVDFDEVEDDLAKFQQDELVKEALQKGVDLRVYSQHLDADLVKVEESALMDYIANAESLATLHTQLTSCEHVLSGMHTLLEQFQGDLGDITSEISAIQSQSIVISTKLNNRQKAQRQLGAFVRAVYVPEDIQSQLLQGEINDSYANALHEFDGHLLRIRNGKLAQARALDEVLPQLERLRRTVVARVRNYLLDRIQNFTRANVNVAVQQSELVRFQHLYAFLVHQENDHQGEDSAHVVRECYIDVMSKIYASKFKKYLSEMKKFQLDSNVDKNDLLGVEEGKKSGLLGKARSREDISRVFQLGQRDEILHMTEMDVIYPSQLDKSAHRLPFEKIYRSAQLMLIETAIQEYGLIVRFFGEKEREPSVHASSSSHANGDASSTATTTDSSSDSTSSTSSSTLPSTTTSTSSSAPPAPLQRTASERRIVEKGRDGLRKSSRDKHVFQQVFAKSCVLFEEMIEQFLFSTHDMLSILLVVRCVSKDLGYLSMLDIHAMDTLLDRLALHCWPKFKQLFDVHMASLGNLPLAIPESTSMLSKKVKVPADPGFYALLRYADLAAAVYRLNVGYNDDILTSNMRRMRSEVDKLIQRTLSRCGGPRQQLMFLIVQYHAVVRQLSLASASDSDDYKHFTRVLNEHVSRFVDDELTDKFGRLVPFLKSYMAPVVADENDAAAVAAATAAAEEIAQKPIDLSQLESAIKPFAKSWKEGIEALHVSIMKAFDGVDAQRRAIASALGGGLPGASPSPSNSQSSPTSPRSPSNGAAGSASSSSSSSSPASVLWLTDFLLHQALMQLLLYYQRIHDLMKRSGAARQRPQLVKDVIPITTIMYEVKKYSGAGGGGAGGGQA